ncbi:TfpX/TfpZ family type IV pilin accessory protein [Undibacterium sp. SXout11W]|uniref:TfpX/TfpZ family type IV pilin accessory protein n=1 Tax=Undibacterium sp. SXout11W TaxID=3413050 RepID=UPI003BF00F8D
MISRLKAMFFHVLISGVIAGVGSLLILLLWYPWPLSEMSGGWSLLLLVCSVDVVLGPLLTFVIFDTRKPRSEIVRDLTIIAVLQLSGLCYGVHTVYLARPVVIAFEGKLFRVVSAIEIEDNELSKAPEKFKTLSLTGPTFVGTREVSSEDERFDAIAHAMVGSDKSMRPIFWQAYEKSVPRILSDSKPLTTLLKNYPEQKNALDQVLAKSGKKMDELRYLPLISKFAVWTILLDAKTAQPVSYLSVDSTQ